MSTDSGLDRLHPGLVHHLVNTLGWRRLRPLQQAAVGPVLDGDDCLLLAPTAGGKTEAALLPILTRIAEGGGRGLRVLYVCPLRALLNNLHPRVDGYARWVGGRAGLWHGDVGAGPRRRMLADPPDILLTTPESLESMLVSTSVAERELFAEVHTVVVDEVHAFAGDDRGWHLLAVLERVSRLAGRPLQRIGLSATVGNPEDLLTWLQGSNRGQRPAQVVGTAGASGGSPPPGDVALDHVHSVPGAARVVQALHPGRKRLVFCESRATVEQLTTQLRTLGVTTFASHSSLSRDERAQAEHAFAAAQDCVIVSTSTLELGIDVGDLDHVLQVDAPTTVASFLQRIGRTGRRPGSTRNATFLATDPADLLNAAALLLLWGEDYVEPVTPPPDPAHIGVQQLLALCLQEGRIGEAVWHEWLGGLPVAAEPAALAAHARQLGLVDRDGGMLHIGPEAERRYGRRHFLDLMAVFTSAPELVVIAGRHEIGRVSSQVFTVEPPPGQPRRLSLGGRSWAVAHVDWSRRRCHVEPTTETGSSRWSGAGERFESAALAGARRRVLLGDDPPVTLSRRAAAGLAQLREERGSQASRRGTVVMRSEVGTWWWTFAGTRVNLTLRANLSGQVDPHQASSAERIKLLPDVTPESVTAAVTALGDGPLRAPVADERAVRGLKFADVLPVTDALRELGARLSAPGEEVTPLLRTPRVWRTSFGRTEPPDEHPPRR